MVYAFGSHFAFFGESQEPAPADPSKPDPRARAEMEAFDKLKPEARVAFREALQQFSCAEVVNLVNQRGATPAVVAAARARGLLPYQLGLDGVVVETVRQLDARHTADGYARKERGDRL